jgi:hypothetical protein
MWCVVLLLGLFFKNPTADVPVRVRQPVVAVHAREATIRQPVTQVAKGMPLA